MINKLICKICNIECKSFKSLASHTRQKHKISKKDYYDNFFKTKSEGKCKFVGCNNDTRFYGLKQGYSDFCSQKCYNNFPERLEFARSNMKKMWKNPKIKKSITDSVKKQWKENNSYIKLMKTPKTNFRIKQTISQIKRYEDINERVKTSKSIKEAYDKNPKLRINAANHSKKMWNDPNSKFNTDSYLEKIMMFFRKGKKTKPEVIVEQVLDIVNVKTFKYTGNGTFWINRKNPDFVDFKNKKIIEVFGDYYHSEYFRKKSGDFSSNIEHELDRKKHFEKEGYSCLILWEKETKNFDECKEKIFNFIKG